MKKITAVFTAAVIAALSCPVFAASGDVAGQYYSTDIHTYLNGAEIDSINIGGQTLISAEAMEDYSFSVFWDAGTSELNISRISG